MVESFHRYFQMGVVHPMSFPGASEKEQTLLETVRRVATDEYFDAIEIPYIENRDTCRRIRELCETAGCRIMIAGQPRLLGEGASLNDLREPERIHAIKLVKQCIDMACFMGADEVGVLGGGYEEDRFEEYYSRLTESTAELCRYGKERGVSLLMEVFDYDVDKKSIIGPVDRVRRFARDIRRDHDNFGLLADLSHMPLLKETPRQSMEPVREYIRHLHVGNAVCTEGAEAYGDQHPVFGFLGSSVNVPELREFLKTALDLGLLGENSRPILSFEVKPWKDQDPEAVLANCKRTMNLAWSLV